jgi:multidrug efflux system membrane fusion protein
MVIHRRPVLIAFLSLCLPLSGCSRSSGTGGADAAGRRGGSRGAGAAVPILSARVEQKPMPVTLAAVGTVEAIASVQVRAQVTGQLRAVHFGEGQDVEKGQPLFSIDPAPFKATLQQAEAVLARDSATWQNAQAQQARLDSLFTRGLLSKDQVEAQRASALALAATVAADKASVESARLSLQFTEIKAPISGRTGSLGVHQGDLVRANDLTPMVVINQLSPVYVAFSVPGRYLPAIRRYQAERPLQVSAAIPAASDQSAAQAPAAAATGAAPGVGETRPLEDPATSTIQQGAVSFIDNAVDTTTGTIRLKGTFANTGHQLWPGAFVQVTLRLRTDPAATVVPAVAVQMSQDGPYVYVVKADRTVEIRPVVLDRQQGNLTVIASGVTAGETVVTDGQLRLVPGARVSERGAADTGGPRSAGRDGGSGPDSRTPRGDR